MLKEDHCCWVRQAVMHSWAEKQDKGRTKLVMCLKGYGTQLGRGENCILGSAPVPSYLVWHGEMVLKMGIKICFPCRMSQAQGFPLYLSKTWKLQHTAGTEQILILSCGSQHRTPTPSLLGKRSQQQGELQKSDHLYLLLLWIFISVVADARLRVELNSTNPC